MFFSPVLLNITIGQDCRKEPEKRLADVESWLADLGTSFVSRYPVALDTEISLFEVLVMGQ